MSTPTEQRGFKMPPEWARHDATWLAWPNDERSWPGYFESIPLVFTEIVRVLSTSGAENVNIVCKDSESRRRVHLMCKHHGALLMERCTFYDLPTDWPWFRDTAPTAVRDESGEIHWVHWKFNGWAKYKNHKLDLGVPSALARWTKLPLVEALRPDRKRKSSLVMEGGAFDVNGLGMLLTTEECLLSKKIQVRNPGMSKETYEAVFNRYLGKSQTIWLLNGCAGDSFYGTNGHVDDVARFTDSNTIVLACEENTRDENYRPSRKNMERLQDVRSSMPQRLTIIKLPYPAPIHVKGQRLPASYANFYIANKAVLVPTFNDPNDRKALDILSGLFPGREVVGIHSRELVWGYGTIHCLLQQQPA